MRENRPSQTFEGNRRSHGYDPNGDVKPRERVSRERLVYPHHAPTGGFLA